MQTAISLDSATEIKIRALYPCTLNTQDIEFVADWLMKIGISTVHAAMAKHPQMTIGDLMNLTFKTYDA
ncbi:hypothetical protein MTYP_02084 [Methylophilaceae bacterium]|nr:hypothetical protein MTYP_02084 [Methylophilaceae bacterium]